VNFADFDAFVVVRGPDFQGDVGGTPVRRPFIHAQPGESIMVTGEVKIGKVLVPPRPPARTTASPP
jgi:hypothetical protein